MSKKKKRGVTLPMDFSDALRQMREGLAVGRLAWCDEKGFYKNTIEIIGPTGGQDGQIVEWVPMTGIKRGWNPTQEDILATDWSLCTSAVQS